MQITFLKKIAENTAGPEAIKIVDLLEKKKIVNEFLIAKKLSLTINQTRNLLYKLSHRGIISSSRKKDARKGWYIYFWTINRLKSLEILNEEIELEIQTLKNQAFIKKAERFYECEMCKREVNEETALLSDFLCRECGEVYKLADNSKKVEEIESGLAKVQKEKEKIYEEIELERSKIQKSVDRKNKIIETAKKDARKKAREKREKEKSKKTAKNIKKRSKKNKKR